ncbi:MAG TPA: hypothetical protein ENK57_10165 [Polyangiaceae bacterium]|nr:hypothetical protein [Polyangiaceae bacterium]
MDPKDRVLYVQIIAQVLIADGVLADRERAHLDRIASSLKMPDDEKRAALSGVSLDSPVEERVSALSDAAKSNLLDEVEKALHVDGEISNSEKYLLERVRKLVS